MATREEEHATRGRANALVKALSQPDPAAALGDERLHEILDLCLECKACKSECPLSVDMATLKSEFLAHHNAIHGTPLRSRLFGSIRTLNKLGSATAPLSNAPVPRRLLEKVAGIDRRRPLPRFERETLIRWASARPKRAATRGEVVFLADSFTTFTEPAVGRAAIELLDAAGHDVRLESGGCCGRASISKGLLDDARAKAAALTERLQGDAVITGCEPSCLLTLREEHVQLLGDRGVAKRTRLVEELLVEAIDDGALKLRDLGPRRILFHGHCHQKALAGTAATVALLRRLPGAEVEELDAGCCGMAGSFGFEAEHYELRPINMGLLGITAAFIVGSAVGVSEDDIFAGFPGDLFIILVVVNYLFAIANNNGTVDWLVHAAVRAVRGRVALIPWVMFGITAVLTAVGSVVPAAVAIVAPIALGFAVRYKINPVMMGLMVVNGATAGGFSPISIFGSIVNGVVERNDLAGNPTLLFFSSLIFNTLLSVVVFFLFGGRDLMNRRVDTDPAATERFKRETTPSGQPTIAGGAVAMSAEAPELNRDRILTLLGIVALVTLALMPGIDWDVGFVAVSIAVILSLAMPNAAKGARRRSPGRPSC